MLLAFFNLYFLEGKSSWRDPLETRYHLSGLELYAVSTLDCLPLMKRVHQSPRPAGAGFYTQQLEAVNHTSEMRDKHFTFIATLRCCITFLSLWLLSDAFDLPV